MSYVPPMPQTMPAMPTMTSMVVGPPPMPMLAASPSAPSMYVPVSGMQTPAPAPPPVVMPPPVAYAPPPFAYPAPALAVPPPQAPDASAKGMKAPQALEAEAAVFHKALEGQLAKEVAAAEKEGELEKQMLQRQAQMQIAQLTLQVEEQTKRACMAVDQKIVARTSQLHEAAIQRRTVMEEKAAIAAMEFNKRKAMDELAQKNYTLQKEYYDAEMKMLQHLQQVGGKPLSAVPPIPGGAV